MTNVPCPCCGNLTLSARSRFEICPVCGWEDDGQDDADAHEVASRLAADLECGTAIAEAVRDQFEFRPSRGPLAWVRGLLRKSPRHQASPLTSAVPVHKRYVSWGREEIKGLPIEWTRVVTEIDPNGRVLREIGLNTKGEVVHRAPSPINNHGLFDQVPVDAGPDSDATAEEFEGWWQAALEPPGR